MVDILEKKIGNTWTILCRARASYRTPGPTSKNSTLVAHRILTNVPHVMGKSEKAPRRRKRQPPKSGSQNARRALVETECVWETSSALFLVCSGSMPPTLPSLSSTPRCRWSRKHHSMSRKQDDGERMGTFAAVRVSSNRVEPHHHLSTAVALCQLARHFQP